MTRIDQDPKYTSAYVIGYTVGVKWREKHPCADNFKRFISSQRLMELLPDDLVDQYLGALGFREGLLDAIYQRGRAM